MLTHATRFVPVVLVLGLLMIAFPAAATTTPDYPCRSHNAVIYMHIYGNNGVIQLGSYQYHDGQQTTVAWGCGQSYAINGWSTSTIFYFRQWAADYGTFGSSTAASTIFHPAGSTGLALVLGLGTSSASPGESNWGGYVAGDTNFGTNTIVSGTFVVPSSVSYVSAPNNGEDIVAFWVGVGGFNGNQNLWQAGVDISMYNGQSPGASAWYEQVSPASGCCAQFSLNYIPPTYATYPVSLGDTITVSLGYYQEPLFNITDGTSWASRKWSTLYRPCEWGPAVSGLNPSTYCISGFQPDPSTAEYIAEAPITAWSPLFGSPCGVPQGAQCVMPNYGSFSVPSNCMSVTGFYGWSMPYFRVIGYDYQNHGYSNPGLIANGWPSSGAWSDQYGTSPVG